MKPMIAITMGDPAGIGAEVTVRALTHRALYDICTPLVIGSAEALADANRFTGAGLTLRAISSLEEASQTPGTITFLDPAPLAPGAYVPGQVSAACGDAAFFYVVRGIELAKSGDVAAVVTGPINKEALNLAGHHFDGHTEIFAQFTHTKNYAMLLASGNLRVIHVTTHILPFSAAGLRFGANPARFGDDPPGCTRAFGTGNSERTHCGCGVESPFLRQRTVRRGRGARDPAGCGGRARGRIGCDRACAAGQCFCPRAGR